MKKEKLIFIKLHSFVDLITNSSTELYVVDSSKSEGILKEIFDLIIKEGNSGYDETKIECLINYKYKSDYIIPEDLDQNTVFICNIDRGNIILMKIIEKYFTTINLKYNG